MEMAACNAAALEVVDGDIGIGRCGHRHTDAHNGGGILVVGGIECHILAFAPDVLFETGIVDVGIAVVLDAVDGLVAVAFLVAHGVVLRPLQEHVEGPGLESGPCVSGKHDAAFALRPLGKTALVGGGHIEIGACKVALVFVGRFKHRTAVSGNGRRSHLAEPLCTLFRGALHLAEGEVSAHAVHIAVGGIEVEEVGVCRNSRTAAPPAFRERMLTVVLVALGLEVSGLVVAEGVVGDAAVHVPHLSVRAAVRFAEVYPKVGIGTYGMVADDVREGGLQGCTLFAGGRGIVCGLLRPQAARQAKRHSTEGPTEQTPKGCGRSDVVVHS